FLERIAYHGAGQDLVLAIQAQHPLPENLVDILIAVTTERRHPSVAGYIVRAAGRELRLSQLGLHLFSGSGQIFGQTVDVGVLEQHAGFLGYRSKWLITSVLKPWASASAHMA